MVNRPLNRLIRAIDRIEQGDLDYRIEESGQGREFEQINRILLVRDYILKPIDYDELDDLLVQFQKEREKRLLLFCLTEGRWRRSIRLVMD